MSSDFVPRILRQFKNKNNEWFSKQTFSASNGLPEVASASFTIGAEVANVINVAIQLKDNKGRDIQYKAYVQAYLSSDAAGDALEATAPDSVAIGTDGTIFLSGGDNPRQFGLRSEADGDIDIDITEATGADTVYLNVIIGSVVYTSGAITFAA